jgi:hypothetical protein
MNKITIIVVCVGTIILVTAGLVFLHKPTAGPVNQNEPTNSFPVGNPTNTNTDVKTVKTTTGVAVPVKDFINDPSTVVDEVNKGNYYLGNHFSSDGAPPAQMPPYVITYIASTQYFSIGLFTEPLGESRKKAEQYLMNQLGITQVQMCTLNYIVSVPNFVNEKYSGTNLKFSFCEESVPLK